MILSFELIRKRFFFSNCASTKISKYVNKIGNLHHYQSPHLLFFGDDRSLLKAMTQLNSDEMTRYEAQNYQTFLLFSIFGSVPFRFNISWCVLSRFFGWTVRIRLFKLFLPNSVLYFICWITLSMIRFIDK